MRQVMEIKGPINPTILVITGVAFFALSGGKTLADDLLGMYVGGAVGQAQVVAEAS